MNIHSVKSRFSGSYLFIALLMVVQLPLIYMLVVSMSSKYTQVEQAGSLRKRAVELNYLLNRHILNGEEELEAVFQDKKKEFGAVIDELKTGSASVPAITGAAALDKLSVVESKWGTMNASLDSAMESGDAMSETITELEHSTFPMVGKLNTIVVGFVDLKDPKYSKSINLAGLQRMRTVKMAYLMERYARSNFELEEVSAELTKTMDEFETTFSGLRFGSAALGLAAVNNTALLDKFKEAETLWLKRKELVTTGMKAKDTFQANVMKLATVNTPELVAATESLTQEIAVAAKAAAMKGLLALAAAVCATVAVAFFFLWSTNNQIIKPILRIKETVEEFAKGRLSQRANVKVTFLGRELKDEITSLGDSVDEMAGQMSNLIGRISESSTHLASASEELSCSAGQIAEGAERQSGQTMQVATAMEEMNATVVEVAKNSQRASESANDAQQIATRGGDVVSEAIAAMKEVAESTSVTAETIKKLGTSSEEIGTIVSVINDIADQTNLLALNAAIEAARAGEQGRGFAVVADEVRKLAERTTQATKEISGMIKTIQTETSTAVDAMAQGTKKVENGVNLANEAGESLMQIVSGVQNVTDMISHIATSAEQQSSTTEEITQSMDSIAEVAKTNVNAIDEVTNATKEMARLATELQGLVSSFKVDGTSAECVIEDIGKRRRGNKFSKDENIAVLRAG